MAKMKDRDIEKGYTTKEMVAKLRRLADCLEQGKPFQIQIAGERIQIPAKAVFSVEHEREGGMEEVESSSSSGRPLDACPSGNVEGTELGWGMLRIGRVSMEFDGLQCYNRNHSHRGFEREKRKP